MGTRPAASRRKGAVDLHPSRHRIPDFSRTDDSAVPLEPHRPARPDAQPPSTVPLVLKLLPGMQ